MSPLTLCLRNLRFQSAKASNVFRPHYAEKFENAIITGYFGFVFEENHMIIVMSSFSRSSVFKMFPQTQSRQFSNSSGLRSVFEKRRSRDGQVWMVGLSVKIMLGYQIFPA